MRRPAIICTVENSKSSHRQCQGQPPAVRKISSLTRNPVPVTLPLKPSSVRGQLRKRTSRMKHSPCPAATQPR